MTGLDNQLTIRTSGGADELFRLLDWFRNDDSLRGRVSLPDPQVYPGQMGDIYDVLVVTVGAGGLAPALVRSLHAWFTTRRTDIQLTLKRNGMEVHLDAKRVEAPELVREIEGLLGSSPDER